MKDDVPDYSHYTLEELYSLARNSENTLFSRQYRQVMKEIEKREHALLTPASQTLKTLWRCVKWGAIVAFLLLLGSIAFPIYVLSQRPPSENFTVTQSFAKTLQKGDVAKLRNVSRHGVVVEGPCNGGCEGGIAPAAKMKELLPQWRLRNSGATSVVWLVQMRPDAVRRRNDMFGEDEINIHSKPAKAGTVYFAVVPEKLVRDQVRWVRVVVERQ